MSDGTFDYVREPQAIYTASFAAIRESCDVSSLPGAMQGIALRIAHAAGDSAAIAGLDWSDGAAEAGIAALKAGAPVLADARMVAEGVIRSALPANNRVICTLGLGSVAGNAARGGTTRSAAAVELWPEFLSGAVVAIGNAPTALFRLLQGLAAGWPKPALIVGMPVGYIGAAESKSALSGLAPAPFIVLTGQRGGSAIAAATVNALSRAAS